MSSTALLDASPAERPSGLWDYVSPTRLNLWLRCPARVQFHYVEGLVPPPTPSLFVGKRTHDALEHFYRHRQLGVGLSAEQVTARLEDTWDEAAAEEHVSFASADEQRAAKDQAVGLVKEYLRQLPASEPRPLAVETTLEAPLADPFTGEDLGLPLLGVVDLVLDGREGPVICDFKTSAKSSTPAEIVHEVQLTAYAILFRKSPENGKRDWRFARSSRARRRRSSGTFLDLAKNHTCGGSFGLWRAYLRRSERGRFRCTGPAGRARCASTVMGVPLPGPRETLEAYIGARPQFYWQT